MFITRIIVITVFIVFLVLIAYLLSGNKKSSAQQTILKQKNQQIEQLKASRDNLQQKAENEKKQLREDQKQYAEQIKSLRLESKKLCESYKKQISELQQQQSAMYEKKIQEAEKMLRQQLETTYSSQLATLEQQYEKKLATAEAQSVVELEKLKSLVAEEIRDFQKQYEETKAKIFGNITLQIEQEANKLMQTKLKRLLHNFEIEKQFLKDQLEKANKKYLNLQLQNASKMSSSLQSISHMLQEQTSVLQKQIQSLTEENEKLKQQQQIAEQKSNESQIKLKPSVKKLKQQLRQQYKFEEDYGSPESILDISIAATVQEAISATVPQIMYSTDFYKQLGRQWINATDFGIAQKNRLTSNALYDLEQKLLSAAPTSQQSVFEQWKAHIFETESKTDTESDSSSAGTDSDDE